MLALLLGDRTGVGVTHLMLATLRQRSYEAVVLALLVGCAIWVGKLVSYNRELGVTLAATGSLAEQSSVRDRLLGAVLPLCSRSRSGSACQWRPKT